MSSHQLSEPSSPPPSSDFLVWIDLEMSGLNPDEATILEIACIVTTGDLDIVYEAPAIAISHPVELLEGMDEWNKEHHSASGLWDRVLTSKIDLEEAETILLQQLEKIVAPNSSPLCGNSICQDRRFLYRYMPKLSEFLHYRSIDVSSFKEVAKRWYPQLVPFPKKNAHRALDDIRESIAELQWYRKLLFIDTPRRDQ